MEKTAVLLVEDNKLLRDWIAGSLSSNGFSVVAPERMTDALDLAATRPFDVLVTDWRLSEGFDGFDVLDVVRRKSPRVLSMLISADADAHLAERAGQAGFDAVLEKPFPPWKIVAALHSLLKAQPLEAVS